MWDDLSGGKAPLENEALTQLQDFLFSVEMTFLVAEMTSVKVLIFNAWMVRGCHDHTCSFINKEAITQKQSTFVVLSHGRIRNGFFGLLTELNGSGVLEISQINEGI